MHSFQGMGMSGVDVLTSYFGQNSSESGGILPYKGDGGARRTF